LDYEITLIDDDNEKHVCIWIQTSKYKKQLKK